MYKYALHIFNPASPRMWAHISKKSQILILYLTNSFTSPRHVYKTQMNQALYHLLMHVRNEG